MTLIPAIALGLLAALLLAAPVAAAVLGEGVTLLPNTAAAADAAGAWLTLAGLGLISSGAGLIVLGRRNRLGR